MHALDKRQVRFTVDFAEYLELEARARQAQTTVQNYIRRRLRFPERLTARPDAEEPARQEDEAWERLLRLGLDPKEYFPERSDSRRRAANRRRRTSGRNDKVLKRRCRSAGKCIAPPKP